MGGQRGGEERNREREVKGEVGAVNRQSQTHACRVEPYSM